MTHAAVGDDKQPPTARFPLNRPILACTLQLHHMGIQAVLSIQGIGTPLFGHHTIGQHHNLIGSRHGAHPVGNDKHSFIVNQP